MQVEKIQISTRTSSSHTKLQRKPNSQACMFVIIENRRRKETMRFSFMTVQNLRVSVPPATLQRNGVQGLLKEHPIGSAELEILLEITERAEISDI